MAFIPRDLVLHGDGNGLCNYRYDTLDVLTTVDGNGYINNNTHVTNLHVGDLIDVVVWATAIRTGTISDVGRLIVMQVAANGDVDLSNDLIAQTPATGD